jgi:hypothetical protein
MCSRRQRTLPAPALADAEQLQCGEPCGARGQRQPRRLPGFFPHEGLGAAALLVAAQPQRPQGLELPGAVRRELRTGHRVAALDVRGPKRKKLISIYHFHSQCPHRGRAQVLSSPVRPASLRLPVVRHKIPSHWHELPSKQHPQEAHGRKAPRARALQLCRMQARLQLTAAGGIAARWKLAQNNSATIYPFRPHRSVCRKAQPAGLDTRPKRCV